MRIFLITLMMVVSFGLPVVAFAAVSGDNPCSCTFWEPTRSDAAVVGLTIEIEADTLVTADDRFYLKLVDDDGKSVHYVKLTIPKDGTNVIRVEYDDTIASQLHSAELFSPNINVDMKYMKVVGELEDGEYVFFEKGCDGIVVGPKGCKRMELL